MPNIVSFHINQSAANLKVVFDNQHSIDLSFEYLRVFAPTGPQGKPSGLIPQVYHKKLVQLLAIESVGKHGYRFIFDDKHNDIYPAAYLQVLATEQSQRWQKYLASANSAINSREATIEIKEVK